MEFLFLGEIRRNIVLENSSRTTSHKTVGFSLPLFSHQREQCTALYKGSLYEDDQISV